MAVIERLSPSDLQILTGYQRSNAQLRWLETNGWPHVIDGLGRPVVDRAEYEGRMRSPAGTPTKRKRGPAYDRIGAPA